MPVSNNSDCTIPEQQRQMHKNVFDRIEHAIEKQAALYGGTLNNLKEEGHLMITLDDVIEAGYFIADENGNVVDPRNSSNVLNGIKIKLVYENDKVTAEVIEEE